MYVSLLSLFYVRCSVVTAIFALSVTVLVLFALAFGSIKEGVAIDTKLTRANQDLAAADRKLKAAADTARYNGETSDAYRKRSNQLVDYLREVLMALELGSLVEDDPLSTPVGVLSDNASKFAQSRRLLEDCARMLGCPGDLSAVPVRMQTAIGRLTDTDRIVTTLTKFLEEVESRVGRPVIATSIENRKQMAIEALDAVVATLAEKGGKLDHYRAAIDAALGGVRQDGERWSVVHIRAIEELKAQVAAKMNEAVECSLDPLCKAADCDPEALLDVIIQLKSNSGRADDMERLLNVMIENRTRICRTLKIDENSGCDEQGHSYPEVLEFRLNEKDAAIRRWLDVVRDRDQWLARIAVAVKLASLWERDDDGLDSDSCNDSLEFIAMNNRLVSLLRQWCDSLEDPMNLTTVRQMQLRAATEELIGLYDGTFAGGPNAEGNYDPPV